MGGAQREIEALFDQIHLAVLEGDEDHDLGVARAVLGDQVGEPLARGKALAGDTQ